MADTWLFPIGSWFNNPPPLSLGKSCPVQYSCIHIAGWGYLIKMHSYMMPQLNICHMSQYAIGDNFNPKHRVTKSMVGPLPLAPHHDYLQYMYHVYVMQMGSKPGCYIWHGGRMRFTWSDVSAEMLWCDCRLCYHMITTEILWCDYGMCSHMINVDPFWCYWGMCSHMIRYKCRDILMWLWDVFLHDQCRAFLTRWGQM